MSRTSGDGETTVVVPKVAPLEEEQLVPLGFRSQKDLSIVSQLEVWRLVDGAIGSDPSQCSVCIRNKAIAPRHAMVRSLCLLSGVTMPCHVMPFLRLVSACLSTFVHPPANVCTVMCCPTPHPHLHLLHHHHHHPPRSFGSGVHGGE
mgnify:CR=1 FL=1